MATIVNNPNGSNSDSGMGMVLGLIIGILLVIFLIVYGVPVIRNTLRPAETQNNQPGIEINLPNTPSSGNSGSSAQ